MRKVIITLVLLAVCLLSMPACSVNDFNDFATGVNDGIRGARNSQGCYCPDMDGCRPWDGTKYDWSSGQRVRCYCGCG
jgi:hypothetical protein